MYPVDDVGDIVDDTRRSTVEIARAASGGTDGPLVDYVLDRFPETPEPDRSAPTQQCFHTIGVLPAVTVTSVFGRIVEVINDLRSIPSIRIDSILVTSVPPHLPFRFHTRHGSGLGFDNTTDATLPNVVRGLYTISIQLPGYVPLEQEINLVQSSAPRIRCHMVANGEQGTSSCSY